MIRPESIADVMGGTAILGRRIRSIGDLEKTISHGLPKRALRLTAERVYASAGEARRVMFLIVPEATFKRRTRLSPAESERTERLARVIAAAEYAWNDRGDAREWLAARRGHRQRAADWNEVIVRRSHCGRVYQNRVSPR